MTAEQDLKERKKKIETKSMEKMKKEDKGAFGLGIGQKMDAVLKDSNSLTKLLASLNVITESSRMTPLSSGRHKTPIGMVSSGITKGIIQGKQIETAETAAQARLFKSMQKSTKFTLSPAEEGDLTWINEYNKEWSNIQKKNQQVNLRYNLIYGVKDHVPTGAFERIISPIRKITADLFEGDDEKIASIMNVFTGGGTFSEAGLSNEEIVAFQDKFKAISMEQVIQDAKNLYPVSEADVQRLLDAAGDIGTFSSALKNLLSIQKAAVDSAEWFGDGLDKYYQLSGGSTRVPVKWVSKDGFTIVSNNFRDFAKDYAEYMMSEKTKELTQGGVNSIFKQHTAMTGKEVSLEGMTNFEKLASLYNLNLASSNILNFKESDLESRQAWAKDQAEKSEKTMEEIWDQLEESKKGG